MMAIITMMTVITMMAKLDPADTISIELAARDDSCTSEVDLMRKYPEFDG